MPSGGDGAGRAARFDAEEDALVFRRIAGHENWRRCSMPAPSTQTLSRPAVISAKRREL